MDLRPIHFAINSYKAYSGLLSSERLINFYAELVPIQDAFKVAIYGTPGFIPWLSLGNFQPVYGIEKMGENIFVVCGLDVLMIDVNKNITSIGTMSASPGRVMMTNNGTQVTILCDSGVAFYCTTTASSLTQITDGDYDLSSSVTTMDGFTIFTNQASTRYQISALNDTSSYAALDFDNVLANSDNLVAAITNNLEVWFFKETITEVYYNSGNATFPFQRKNGVFIQKGCAAKYSISIIDNSFYFLGNDRIIYQTNGYQLQQISTFPISKEIESYEVVSDAFSFIYTQAGHKFYCITFPTANKTWVYDISTTLWHERQSLNPASFKPEEWRPNSFVFFNGLNLVGDPMNGTIYQLDLDTYDEDGTPLISTAVSTTQFDNYKRDAVGTLVLMMDTGVGTSTGQGSEPQIMMKTSIDGGKTWSNELWQPMGEIGAYQTEIFWNRVAYGRTLILELSISDPVKRAIIGAYLDVSRGTA